MVETLISDNLRSIPGITHAFFTRTWGDGGRGQTLEANSNSADNRSRMAAHLGTDSERLLSCYQIHSPDVVTVEELWDMEARPKADAMVTKIPGVALGILTADCVPVLFADMSAKVIGACHAGWRGAVSGVIENTVAAMEKLGAQRHSIHAAIGPCIWQTSYEVGPEFPAPFLAEDPANEKFFRPSFKSGHYMFDLPGYAAAKLRSLGLASVEISMADTAADEARFFSHRRSTLQKTERGGNLMSAIMVKP